MQSCLSSEASTVNINFYSDEGIRRAAEHLVFLHFSKVRYIGLEGKLHCMVSENLALNAKLLRIS